MTNNAIRKLVNQLNKRDRSVLFTRIELTDTVVYAKASFKTPNCDSAPLESIYFVKHAGEYIGAVLDMVNNLHWFISRKNRKGGHLWLALTEVILPHLMQNRDQQEISIDRNHAGAFYKASEKVALKAGFKKVPGTDGARSKYIVHKQDIKAFNSATIKRDELSPEEVDSVISNLELISNSLKYFQAVLEMKLNSNYGKGLKIVVDGLDKQISEMECDPSI